MGRRVYPVLCVGDGAQLDACRDFYGALLDLETVFECGWYTTLRSPVDASGEVAFVLAGHHTVPEPYGRAAAGVLVSFEVHDVEDVHQRAVSMGAEIVLGLRDEPFGQRHFMARDPVGLLVDVVQPIAMSAAFLREVAQWRRGRR
jgi:catechol 2,3-dioxygenase-like lactoylglutathione lyase family enzyme